MSLWLQAFCKFFRLLAALPLFNLWIQRRKKKLVKYLLQTNHKENVDSEDTLRNRTGRSPRLLASGRVWSSKTLVRKATLPCVEQANHVPIAISSLPPKISQSSHQHAGFVGLHPSNNCVRAWIFHKSSGARNLDKEKNKKKNSNKKNACLLWYSSLLFKSRKGYSGWHCQRNKAIHIAQLLSRVLPATQQQCMLVVLWVTKWLYRLYISS